MYFGAIQVASGASAIKFHSLLSGEAN